jgi:PAS domain S-box-containing protein
MLIEGQQVRTIYRKLPDQHPSSSHESELFSLNTPHFLEMVTSRLPICIEDTAQCAYWIDRPNTRWVRSYLAVPIQARNQVIGFVNLDSSVPGFFSREHAEQLQTFASQAAIAIENAQLYAEIRHYADGLEERVEQRTAEVNRARVRVEAIFNSSSDPIILAHQDGTIQQVNLAFDKTFGYQGDETFGLSLLGLLTPQSASVLSVALETVIDCKQQRRVEVVAQRKDGSLFDVEAGVSYIINGNGRPAAIVCTLRDITERKRTEQALRQALQREKELGELKTRFISMASHEFRTPLATILAAAESLSNYRKRMDESQIDGRLAKVQAQVKHMTSLLDDVLTVGRAESGKLEFKPVPLDLAAFCQNIFEEIQNTAGPLYRLRYASSCAATEVPVLADPKLMRQIVSNLITNALKYSPQGGDIVVSLECDQTSVIFGVSDQGIGIPEDDQKHLFQPFHRAANVGTIQGTGLGLAIVKHAVELHQGSISFESAVGQGATFRVKIPKKQG